jgi:hypothetical protein
MSKPMGQVIQICPERPAGHLMPSFGRSFMARGRSCADL